MADHPVPTIDISPYLEGGDADRDEVARAVDRACRETGFFAIVGHGVPEPTVDGLRREAVDFFALPEGEKRLVERPADRISRGWNALRDRSLAYSLGKDTPPDLQESFAMGPVAVPDEPYYTCDRARAFFAANIWPADRSGFRDSMEGYYRAMEGLSHTVMRIFARALGREDGYFDDRIDRHSSSLRLIRYPGRTERRRAGSAPGGRASRLRLAHDSARRQPAGRAPGQAAPRRLDRRGPAGRRVHLQHRRRDDALDQPPLGVDAPPGRPAGRRNDGPDRISIVFFHNPNYDAEIRCIADDGEPARYPPCAFDSFYVEKLRRGSFGARRAPETPADARGV